MKDNEKQLQSQFELSELYLKTNKATNAVALDGLIKLYEKTLDNYDPKQLNLLTLKSKVEEFLVAHRVLGEIRAQMNLFMKNLEIQLEHDYTALEDDRKFLIELKEKFDLIEHMKI